MIYEGDVNKLTPEAAKEQLFLLHQNPVYLGLKGTLAEQQLLYDESVRLMEIIIGKTDTMTGFYDEREKKKIETMREQYNDAEYGKPNGRHASFGQRVSDQPPESKHSIGFGERNIKGGYGGRIEDAK